MQPLCWTLWNGQNFSREKWGKGFISARSAWVGYRPWLIALLTNNLYCATYKGKQKASLTRACDLCMIYIWNSKKSCWEGRLGLTHRWMGRKVELSWLTLLGRGALGQWWKCESGKAELEEAGAAASSAYARSQQIVYTLEAGLTY